MGNASKGKSKPPAKVREPKIRAIKEQFAAFKAAITELVAEKTRNIAIACAQKFGALEANDQVLTQCVEVLDVQQSTTAKMIREIFGRFEQVDHFLQKSDIDTEIPAGQMQVIKKNALDSYSATLSACLALTNEEREAHRKKKEEERKAAEVAEKALVEAQAAEKALEDAESKDSSLGAEPGGPGSDIPEGATVFGG